MLNQVINEKRLIKIQNVCVKCTLIEARFSHNLSL